MSNSQGTWDTSILYSSLSDPAIKSDLAAAYAACSEAHTRLWGNQISSEQARDTLVLINRAFDMH